MPGRDLKAKYNSKITRLAMNRAIRAELPGGNQLLEALEAVYVIRERTGDYGLDKVLTLLHGVRAAYEDRVRAHWGMPPRGKV